MTGAGPCLVRWVGRLGAVLWATGSGMLANEPQGDPEHDRLRSRYGTSGYDDTVGRGTGTIGFRPQIDRQRLPREQASVMRGSQVRHSFRVVDVGGVNDPGRRDVDLARRVADVRRRPVCGHSVVSTSSPSGGLPRRRAVTGPSRRTTVRCHGRLGEGSVEPPRAVEPRSYARRAGLGAASWRCLSVRQVHRCPAGWLGSLILGCLSAARSGVAPGATPSPYSSRSRRTRAGRRPH